MGCRAVNRLIEFIQSGRGELCGCEIDISNFHKSQQLIINELGAHHQRQALYPSRVG